MTVVERRRHGKQNRITTPQQHSGLVVSFGRYPGPRQTASLRSQGGCW